MKIRKLHIKGYKSVADLSHHRGEGAGIIR